MEKQAPQLQGEPSGKDRKDYIQLGQASDWPLAAARLPDQRPREVNPRGLSGRPRKFRGSYSRTTRRSVRRHELKRFSWPLNSNTAAAALHRNRTTCRSSLECLALLMDGDEGVGGGSPRERHARSAPKQNGLKEHRQDASVKVEIEGAAHQMKNAEAGEVCFACVRKL